MRFFRIVSLPTIRNASSFGGGVTAGVRKPDGGVVVVSAAVRLEWDVGALYFLAEVTDPLIVI